MWTLHVILLISLLFAQKAVSVPFVVQSLSSSYAIILGGYGPGYKELREVEVVKHDKVCSGVIKYIHN